MRGDGGAFLGFQERRTLWSARKKLDGRFKEGGRRRARNIRDGEHFPVAKEELYENYAIAVQQLNEMFETDYVS